MKGSHVMKNTQETATFEQSTREDLSERCHWNWDVNDTKEPSLHKTEAEHFGQWEKQMQNSWVGTQQKC